MDSFFCISCYAFISSCWSVTCNIRCEICFSKSIDSSYRL